MHVINKIDKTWCVAILTYGRIGHLISALLTCLYVHPLVLHSVEHFLKILQHELVELSNSNFKKVWTKYVVECISEDNFTKQFLFKQVSKLFKGTWFKLLLD